MLISLSNPEDYDLMTILLCSC